MPQIKRILCLANSRKPYGRCVAGRELGDGVAGAWIRPVSMRSGQEVSEYERQYQDGSDPKVLDIIDVPLVRHHPHGCQNENWLLDPEYYWVKAGRVGWVELLQHVESPAKLWINGYSTYHGENDEIPQEEADALLSSLVLISVSELWLRVFVPGAAFGDKKRRVQARFHYRGARYALRVTDPIVEREYLYREDGEYPVGESCLCISLSEPFRKQGDGPSCRYKLVATMIEREKIRS